ncbi:PREDICTED: protein STRICTOSIDINE SYNTHASE-LIKE 5-like [Tarenaya hassleriana]|uniref:protein STRICTOSIDINE SYNTHASE-LIKE 5-like n=1 Tax=Tarenaya hassleriana TaxID=28532 RepID=UPI00053C9F93|nr:PREDICTED: protein STRICTOSIDINE SYNTHASE-LIKE 5-like [Tarenaya hassleriana]
MDVLADEAESVKLKLTDGIDVAEDGVIYSLDDLKLGFLEGKPHGRLLSYDLATSSTTVLLSHLYYPNGLSLSPLREHLVFSETPLRRCSKYYTRGEKRGNVELFVQGLPSIPDNIRYDGEGHY